MNVKHFRLYFLSALLFTLLSGCNITGNFQRDPFYEAGSEWDHQRFPLIKPYYAIYKSDEYGWQIPLPVEIPSNDLYYYITLQDIRKIAIENGVIMVYTPYKEAVEESVGQKILYWFVFVPAQKIEIGFDKESDFLNYIQQYGVKNPPWREPDTILKEYDQTQCLDWIPDCN
jgi:hypothetical protein